MSHSVLIDFYLYVIRKWTSWDPKVLLQILPLFKREHLEQAWTSKLAPTIPKGELLWSHMVDWKYLISLRFFHCDFVEHSGKLHHHSRARKVYPWKHYSNLKFPMESKLRPWLQATLVALNLYRPTWKKMWWIFVMSPHPLKCCWREMIVVPKWRCS